MMASYPYDELSFEVMREGKILVKMIISKLAWRYAEDHDVLRMFNMLAEQDYPIGKSSIENNLLVISWVCPLSLAKFFIEKFQRDNRCDIRKFEYELSKLKTLDLERVFDENFHNTKNDQVVWKGFKP